MALVTLPRQLTVDINGEPRVGARMFVYDAGTNNVRTAYTTKAYTIDHQQPIRTVEGGIFPAVYVNPAGGDYKIVIQDTDGAEIYSEDNLAPAIDTLTAESVGRALYPRTTAETVAGVTPVNFASLPAPFIFGERFGFNGNNSALNDSAMADAIAVCDEQGGGILVLKAGIYLFSAGFSLPESMQIWGAAEIGTVLKANGNFTFVTFGSASGRLQLHNLTLAGTSKQGVGLQIGDTNHSGQHQLHNVYITGFDVGVRFAAAIWTQFYGCLISANRYGCDFNAGSGSMYSTTIEFYGTIISGNDRNGIAATNTPVRNIGFDFYGGSIENNGSEAPATYPQVVLGAYGNFYFHTYFEYTIVGTKPTAVLLNSTSNGTFKRCYFNGSGVAISAAAASANNIKIEYCTFIATSTLCIDMQSCPQVVAEHNEYDQANVLDHVTSTIITTKIAQQTSGSYSSTLAGGTDTTPSGSIAWSLSGDSVTLAIPAIVAVSNATTQPTLSGTNMPASIRPTSLQAVIGIVTDNSGNVVGAMTIATDGTITLYNGTSATFTNANNKGVQACSVTFRKS